jgi:hypothetical protein
MSRYSIPLSVRRGFYTITSLTPAQIEELSIAFANAKLGDGVSEVSNALIGKIELDEDILANIIQSVFSLVNIYFESKDDIATFTKDFLESYITRFGELEEGEKASFENYLTKLLPSLNIIKQTVKAKDLLIENPSNFISARIVSDIRIVYDDEEELKKVNQNAVVVHHMKIKHFNETGGENETHLSLDKSDLIQLQRAINRAFEKDELIRSDFHKLNFVDPKL